MKTCSWEITRKCNLNCLHCINFSNKTKELKTKDALKVIDILNYLDCKNLNITGGEPLTRNDIFILLEKAKKYNIFTSLISNGTLIDKKNILNIKKYIDKIGISLDSSNSIINDKIRGYGSFKKTIKAINLLNEQKISIILCITISKANKNDLNNIINLSKKLNIKEIHISEIIIRGNACKNKKYLELTNDDKNDLKNKLYKKLNNNFIVNKNCDIKDTNFFISPLSYLYPCIELYQKNDKINFGQLLLLNNKNIKNFKKYCKKNINKNIKCPYITGHSKYISFCLNEEKITCNLKINE
jgi:MoaA/NifB/PqqE/SkfB family radical SAM enzyme